MNKYIVRVGSNVFETIEVEASTKAEAEEIALNESSVEEPIVEEIEKL